jgi:hypothetical protein
VYLTELQKTGRIWDPQGRAFIYVIDGNPRIACVWSKYSTADAIWAAHFHGVLNKCQGQIHPVKPKNTQTLMLVQVLLRQKNELAILN